MVFRGLHLFRTLPRRIEQFEQVADDFAERTTSEKLAGASLGELLDAFRGFLDIRFHRWIRCARSWKLRTLRRSFTTSKHSC